MTGTPRRRSLRIGLTGPIGCGKSTVAGWLAESGAAVIDADAIARAVTGPGEPALDAIYQRFGPAVRRPDGSLDRAALAAVVFDEPGALRALEAIVHPAVRPRLLAEIEAAEDSGVAVVAIEAIRLVEAGLAALCDEVWLIRCELEQQRARLAGRGVQRADAERRIAAQSGMVERLSFAATRTIETDGSPAHVRETVRRALEAAVREARPARSS